MVVVCFFGIRVPDVYGRRGSLVVERRTPEREVGGSILTRVTVLDP